MPAGAEATPSAYRYLVATAGLITTVWGLVALWRWRRRVAAEPGAVRPDDWCYSGAGARQRGRLMPRLEGQIAIVTGAASGFGAAIATRFAREGAQVMLADIDAAGGKLATETLAGQGGDVGFIATDVSDSAEVKAMIDACVEQFGGLDILVNNAGYSHQTRPIVEIPEEDFDDVFATNTKSVYLGAVHGVPVLRERAGT